MADLLEDTLGALAEALVVSGAHAGAHIKYGSADAFSSAAVTEAGIAVFVASFTASLAYNVYGWKVMEDLV